MRSLLHFLIAIILLSVSATCIAKERDMDFNVASIPAEMRKGADAIIRYSHTTIEVVSPTEIHVVRNVAVTIFNDAAARAGLIMSINDPMRKVKSMSGNIYDKNGDKVLKLSNKDVYTAGAETDAFSSDRYHKICLYNYKVYPYTCEYEIESVISSLFYLPDWDPQPAYDCAVLNADVMIQYPIDLQLNYKAYNMTAALKLDSSGDSRMLSASVHNIPASAEPDGFTPGTPSSPCIYITASHLFINDIEGSMNSWKSFGKLIYEVNKDRDALPENIKKEVHALTDTCTTTSSKIDLLYHMLQHSNRYVLMLFGIGGIQTYDAKYVAEKKYGDCKALSNYMKALLKEAQVLSYTALVYGGTNPPAPDLSFPYSVFNHVILCIPGLQDTTWLECTSPTNPTGYMSSFTANRYALLITPDGGILVHTPTLNEHTDKLERSIDIEVSDAMEIKGAVNMLYSGYWWDNEHSNVINVPSAEIEKKLNNKLKIGTYSIGKFSIDQQRHNGIPTLSEQFSLKGSGNISVSGKRMFVSHAIFSLPLTEPPSYDKRDGPFEIKNGFTVSDTVTVHIPANYTMPDKKETVLEFPFGSYRYKVQLTGTTLSLYTCIVLNNGIYSANDYTSYLKMYKQVKTDLSAAIILEKQRE